MCSSLGDLECSNSTQKMENHLLFDFDLESLIQSDLQDSSVYFYSFDEIEQRFTKKIAVDED